MFAVLEYFSLLSSLKITSSRMSFWSLRSFVMIHFRWTLEILNLFNLRIPNMEWLTSPNTVNDGFKAPPPTNSEIKLRSILRSKKIAFKDSQVIWYTGCDKYTPDLLIGKKLIVEVMIVLNLFILIIIIITTNIAHL